MGRKLLKISQDKRGWLVSKEFPLRVPTVVPQVKDLALSLRQHGFDPHPAQWVKDPASLQLWCRLQLQLIFTAWPGNFHMLQGWLKKEN